MKLTKKLIWNSFLLLLVSTLFSCNKEEGETVYPGIPMYYFLWDGIDSMPVTVSSSAFEKTFQIKDRFGNVGGLIIAAAGFYSQQQDTAFYTITSDTIQGKWYNIINEHERIKISMTENKESKPRQIAIAFYVDVLVWNKIFSGKSIHCEQLVIQQMPPKISNNNNINQ